MSPLFVAAVYDRRNTETGKAPTVTDRRYKLRGGAA